MKNILWKPSKKRIDNSNMKKFIKIVNDKYSKNYDDYTSLYQWSVENIPDFWETMWDFGNIKYSVPHSEVIDSLSMAGARLIKTEMPKPNKPANNNIQNDKTDENTYKEKTTGTKWFSGARLNFAENLLRFKDNNTAIIFKGEDHKSEKITYKELYDNTARIAISLREAGITAGDRVVGFMPNMPETIYAMLAATSIGAIWSSCSPDFGIKGVLDRFGQTKPKILFTANGYYFKGKKIDSLKKISDILRQLPSIEKVVVVPYTEKSFDISIIPNAIHLKDFQSNKSDLEIKFEQLPFNHPLYIMYSSGTTGLPKCMVQSSGGILINHLKELILHTDLKREDNIFYFTSCGWMMWNWLVSSLGVGATIVLYDGNPMYPEPDSLWEMAQDEKITVFGTSAGYISALQNTGAKPGEKYDLSPLKTILSTGSPLSIENFEYVYNNIKKDLQLASISGGSDLNGCFALGNPYSPVYTGELQGRGLGLKVEAFDESGNCVLNKQGELVCTAPFPSMPIYFWDDPDGKRYHDAYFTVYPNIWRHGDFIEINDHGGVTIYGRSDTTLNPGGVRIGTAEIYRQVELIEEIEDSIVIGQNWQNDVRIILFVKLKNKLNLTDKMIAKIKTSIKTNASPRHVPAKIISVPDIPYTHTMKKVEIAVKKVISNQLVTNKDAIKNPEALDFFANLEELT